MKTAILSDIHGNLEALTAVRQELDKEAVGRIFCLGDMVGYNANPVECLQLIQEMNALCVAGNHDYAAVGLTSTDYFNPVARLAAIWSGKQLGAEQQAFIKELPLVRKLGEITLVHATLPDPEEWGYILSEEDADDCFESLETTFCFVGHSHLPGVFEEGVGLVFADEGIFQLKEGTRYIINVGSVGQPRDGNPKASFVLFDQEKRLVDFRRLSYDFEKTQEKILAAGLPTILAERLAVGR